MKKPLLTLLLALFPLTACDTGEQQQDAEVDTAPEPAPQIAQPTGQALPDTTAQAVWSYLNEESYANNWTMWPGTTELYEGTEPHGMLLTTYLNEDAYNALTSGSGPMPTGAIIVKENYRPDSTLAAVTVMYAADGYDPEHNNYFWAKYGANGDVEAAGRVESCQQCHSSGDRGYLRTAYDPGQSAAGSN